MKKQIRSPRSVTQATCRVGKKSFLIEGKPTFLYSGEVHYFRIPIKYWQRHLDALVEAGCSAVSTYVPWSWHEFEEGQIDLSGRTHPERNLLKFLDLAAERKLHVILKPGPYVMAEITDQGIPQWLTRNYPETQALGPDGKPWGATFVSYMSTRFRQKAERWLNVFADRVVVPRQGLAKGAVILLQLCNEIGIFSWLGMQADYSPSSLAAWWKYLRERFPDLRDLSRVLDRNIHAYEEIAPPKDVCNSRRDYLLYILFHDFLRWVYADYVNWLVQTLRNRGVAVPFFVNIGGWVYGRAHEFCMNATFHRETAKKVPGLIYGLDHIPEFVSPLNAHDGIVANQLAMELQRRQGPIYSAELQCGSREHGVETYPPELALFYRECIAHGLTGMNFYMFSQGKNPKGRGTDGPMFYWYTALDYQGQHQPTFDAIRQLGRWLKLNGPWLLESDRSASLGVIFYPPLYETEVLFSTLHRRSRLDPAKAGLEFDPLEFRTRAIFDGVIRILTKKSMPYDIVDVTVRGVRDLLRYKRLVLVTNEIFDRRSQEKLVEYVRQGGELVVFPMLPQFEPDFTECRLMEEAFGVAATDRAPSNRVYMGELKDIPVPMRPYVLKGKDARVIATDEAGHPIGVEKSFGRGRLRYFGFYLYYSIEEHPSLWSAMMQLDRVEREAWTDNESFVLQFRSRADEGLLFVGNFHRMPRQARIWVRMKGSPDPLSLGDVLMPPLTGLLLPLWRKLPQNVTLVYALAELLDVISLDRGIQLVVQGARGMTGRLVVRLPKGLTHAKVVGASFDVQVSDGLTIVTYEQTGEPQTIEIF